MDDDHRVDAGDWRVLIVDRDARVRRGLRALLEGEPDIVVSGEAASVDQAVQCDETLHPSVILLDLMLPTAEEGLEAIKLLANGKRRCVAMSWLDALRESAFDVGASGFVLKGAPPEIVLGAIRAVCRKGGCRGRRRRKRL